MKQIIRIFIVLAVMLCGTGKALALDLKSDLGTNATVKFYDYGTTAPDATFNPSAPGTQKDADYDFGDALVGHYIVMHVETVGDYWTHPELLTVQVVGSPGGALTRTRASEMKVEVPPTVIGTPAADGSGWYYFFVESGTEGYTAANGYKHLILDGDIVPKFNLGSPSSVSGNTYNYTSGVWTTSITVGETSFTYNGSEQKTTISNTSIVVKKSGADAVIFTTVTDHVTAPITAVAPSTLTSGQSVNAGSYNATLTAAANGIFTSSKAVGFTIGQMSVTLDWSTPTTFTWDGSPHAPTASVSGLVGTDECTVSGYTIEATGSSSLTGGQAVNVGSYKATATGLSNGNYKLPADPSTAFTIGTASATLSIADVDKTYGDDAFTPSSTTPSSGAITYSSGNTSVVTVSGSTLTIIGAGTALITANQAAAGGYAATSATFTVTVSKATLTVTADAKSKIYGETDPVLTYTATGFKLSDTQASVMTGALTRATGETVNDYAISQGTLSAGDNYTISFTGANLSIEQKAVTLDWSTPTTFTWDGSPHAPTASVSGLVGTDECTVSGYTIEATGSSSLTDGKAVSVGSYKATATGLSNGNYKVPADPSTTFSIITSAAVSAVVTANYITYDGTAQDLVTVGAITGGATGTSADVKFYADGTSTTPLSGIPQATGAGTHTVYYEVTPDGNHTASGRLSVSVSIAKRDITVSVADKSVEYNGSEQSGNTDYSFSNVVDGQTATITYTPAKGKLPDTYDNGSFGIDLKVMSGDNDVTANYNLTTKTAGKLTITDRTDDKYAITVVAKSSTGNVYDGTTKSVSGFETLEFTVEGNTYTVSGLTTSNPSSTDVATLTNAISGTAVVKDAARNDVTSQFNVTTTDGTLEITARPITVSVADKSVEYNGSEQSGNTAYTFSGVLLGQTASITYTPAKGKTVGTYHNGSFGADLKVMSGDDDVTANYSLTTKTAGKLTITDRNPDNKYVITVVAKSSTGNVYDGTAKSVSGFETLNFTVDGNAYTVSGLTTSNPTSTNVATLTNAICGTAVVTDAAENDVTAQFTVNTTNGTLEITQREITVSVEDDSKVYNGSELSGKTAYTFSNVVDGQTATITYTPAKGTTVGSYDNGSYADDLKVMSGGADVTANYNLTTKTAGKLKITSPDDVIVTITGNSNITDYDGKAHSVSGYSVSISNPLYTEADFEFSGTASASRINAGTTPMGLAVDQFSNKNNNFATVTFVVIDGYQTISPIAAAVTITGHRSSTTYDGVEHTASGYDVSISNGLYTESDFTFSGTAEAARTNVGTTPMGLAESQFENISTNFSSVTFTVFDGGQEITALTGVTVTITGHKNTTNYDGEEHSVSDYDVSTSTPLYTTADFTFSGTKEVARTDAGTTNMGLAADQFANTNTNFDKVTFNVTDGYQTINQIAATVTITGHHNVTTYDGKEHSVSGYEADFSTPLYTTADFTFSGTAEAARTEEGTTYMQLDASQFSNKNTNFSTVTFTVTDGYQTITSISDVVVTIIGHKNTTDYDGKEHSVSDYDVSISHPLYTEDDFTFSGTAEAARTDAGTTKMGLAASQFSNTNPDFTSVTFNVTDGYQTINPIAATVTITGHHNTSAFDGKEHSVSGYDLSISNPLYTENDFTFSGTAKATLTDVGTTNMGLAEDQFENTNTNFDNVTFDVTDGYQTITSLSDVLVTITGHKSTVDYDGEEHSVRGYDVEISNPLYTEDDFTFSGTAEAARTDVGTTNMGLDVSQFSNKNADFTNVTFNVTDGYQTISPINATVTIKGRGNVATYDGTTHSVSGYDVSFSNDLYKESDFTFSGKAEAAQTDAGTTNMELTEDMFSNTNTNFCTVVFIVTDGYQTINKKVVAPIVTVTPKTYDGSTDAQVNVSIETGVSGESLTISGLTATFNDANAGTDKAVTVNSINATVAAGEGTKLENYDVNYPDEVNGTITQRPVVVSGITAQDKDYDGTTDATLVFDDAQFDGLIAGDKLTVTATGAFEDPYVGEDKTVNISGLTLGGESAANYQLAAEGQQETTTASILSVVVIDRMHSGIEVRRNDTNDLVDNEAYLTVMTDGKLRIDRVEIINPDPANGIAAGVSVFIPALLTDFDGTTTGKTYGVGSDIIVTDANVPVTDVYMPETEEMLNVALHAFRLEPTENETAFIHVPLHLLDDYALCVGLAAEYAAGKVMTTITPTTQYWTFSSAVDVVVPEDLTANICSASGLEAVAITVIWQTTATVDGVSRILVKANNGVLVKGVANESYDLRAWPCEERPTGYTITDYDAKTYVGNDLVPVINKNHYTPTDFYILYEDLFYELLPDDDTSVSACKAVLRRTSEAQARSLTIGDATTAIDRASIVRSEDSSTDDWYSLDGRKLDGKPTRKGLYIRNGQKVVIR